MKIAEHHSDDKSCSTEVPNVEECVDGSNFGTVLIIKRLPVRGATHVSMQGCTDGGNW